jgi:hypothetical protein
MPPDEFIFGDRDAAGRFAKSQGWREAGRVTWQKPDGTVVHFIKFVEQLESVMRGERVYFTVKPTLEMIRKLHKRGAKVAHSIR